MLGVGLPSTAGPACRELAVIDSPYGHDAFLVETEQVFDIVARALRRPAAGHCAGSTARADPRGSALASTTAAHP